MRALILISQACYGSSRGANGQSLKEQSLPKEFRHGSGGSRQEMKGETLRDIR